MDEIKPTTRPDLDNYAKLTLDALNGIIWTDDSQITELRLGKFYSITPSTMIKVFFADEGDIK
jgi:Holliday junction resolvase RusA-like endonuclease